MALQTLQPLVCGSCTACCERDRVPISHEEADRYKWHWANGQRILDHKPGTTSVDVRGVEVGTCIYLKKGCSIYKDRPLACRQTDCRALRLGMSSKERKRAIAINPTMKAVFAAADARL